MKRNFASVRVRVKNIVEKIYKVDLVEVNLGVIFGENVPGHPYIIFGN